MDANARIHSFDPRPVKFNIESHVDLNSRFKTRSAFFLSNGTVCFTSYGSPRLNRRARPRDSHLESLKPTHTSSHNAADHVSPMNLILAHVRSSASICRCP